MMLVSAATMILGIAPAAPPAPAIDVAADTVVITEWLVPYEESRPRDPFVAPDGRVWFVGQRTDYAAVFAPQTGEFERFDLPEGTGPHNLIVDSDGTVWYAGNRAAHIGKLDPVTGEIEQIATPDPPAGDPHTLVFAPDGNIWFTVQGGNVVGLLQTTTGEMRLLPVETARARPYGIVAAPNGRPWIALFGTNKLATVDTETMRLSEIALPRNDARPRRLVLTSDGNVWYVDHAKGFLGRYSPTNGRFEEWEMPSGSSSRPYAMAVDDRDRLWIVETGVTPNRFVGFDPATGAFFAATEIESGGGSVRHMHYDQRTQSIWFGTDTNYLGRAQLP
jgi:virginiamycin B lyase